MNEGEQPLMQLSSSKHQPAVPAVPPPTSRGAIVERVSPTIHLLPLLPPFLQVCDSGPISTGKTLLIPRRHTSSGNRNSSDQREQ